MSAKEQSVEALTKRIEDLEAHIRWLQIEENQRTREEAQWSQTKIILTWPTASVLFVLWARVYDVHHHLWTGWPNYFWLIPSGIVIGFFAAYAVSHLRLHNGEGRLVGPHG